MVEWITEIIHGWNGVFRGNGTDEGEGPGKSILMFMAEDEDGSCEKDRVVGL
jgi:hypothetical protein